MTHQIGARRVILIDERDTNVEYVEFGPHDVIMNWWIAFH